MFKLFIFTCLVFFTLISSSWANNLVLSNSSLENQNTTNDTWDIEYDISWENSWFDAGAPSPTANWDAAWVFAKYSVWDSGTKSWGPFAHATLSATDTDHTAPAGSQIDTGLTSGEGKGIFIYRSGTGTGTNTWTNASLRWDYGTDGVGDADIICIKVFGVEMVYVPEGSFYIGDVTGDISGNFKWQDGTAGAPQITSALGNAINTLNNAYDDSQLEGTGIRIDGDGGLDTDANGSVDNANFPTGYNAFYLMKYEITNGQYRDFLNTLTRTQQNNRTRGISPNYFVMADLKTPQYRAVIRAPEVITTSASIIFGCDGDIDGVFDEADDDEWTPSVFMSWADLAAYFDWAALRPFTELEFEKACRGGQAAIDNEYVWGDTVLETATSSLSGYRTASELPNQGNVNDPNANPNYVFRVGSFADATSTRANSGAGYYGVMDLGGNAFERTVTVGNTTGRAFNGTLGDGNLSTNGNADVTTWPGLTSGEVTGATGSGFRGTSWSSMSSTPKLADRFRASSTDATVGSGWGHGGRGARTAP